MTAPEPAQLGRNLAPFQDDKDPVKEKEKPLVASSTSKQRFSPLARQTFAALGSIVASVSAGMTSGYSATLLPQLALKDSPIPLTEEVSSWIAAIAALPMPLGCLLSGALMQPLGRRRLHQVLAAPFVLGWALLATAGGLPQLLAGRALQGLCVGLLGPVGSVYIGEVSDPRYRGFLLAGISMAVSAGLLLVHAVGTFCRWQLTAGVSSLLPLLSYVMMSFAPESPSWLASQGRTQDAIESFRWLRGCDDGSLEELRALLQKQAAVDAERLAAPPAPFFSAQRWRELRAVFRAPEFVKPLLIMIAFFMTVQFSGINAVAFYSVSIMKSTLGDGIDEYAAMLAVDGVRLAVSLGACALLRTVGRRPLALWSGFLTAFALFGLATFRYLAADLADEEARRLAWLPLALLVAYIVTTTGGITALPWVMTGEVFPVALRGLGSGVCTCVCFASFFLVVKLAPAMFSGLGVDGTFFTYGVICFLGTCTIYLFLPETRGRTLQDIEESFRRNKTLPDAEGGAVEHVKRDEPAPRA